MSSQTWAQMSNALVYSTIIVLAVALVAFAADLAFGSRAAACTGGQAASDQPGPSGRRGRARV